MIILLLHVVVVVVAILVFVVEVAVVVVVVVVIIFVVVVVVVVVVVGSLLSSLFHSTVRASLTARKIASKLVTWNMAEQFCWAGPTFCPIFCGPLFERFLSAK